MSKILIIENSPTNMRLVVSVLKNAGYQALQAEDASAGIHLMCEAQPDPIFMDIRFPGMDGLKASWLLNAYEATRYISNPCADRFRSKKRRRAHPRYGLRRLPGRQASYKDLLVVTVARRPQCG